MTAPDAASNAFTATLTGATGVRLDLARMQLSTSAPLSGTVTTDYSLTLRLAGGWTTLPSVSVDGVPVSASLAGAVLSISLASGTSNLLITP